MAHTPFGRKLWLNTSYHREIIVSISSKVILPDSVGQKESSGYAHLPIVLVPFFEGVLHFIRFPMTQVSTNNGEEPKTKHGYSKQFVRSFKC